MKILVSLVLTIFFATTLFAQSTEISKKEYNKVMKFAVSETNEDYPLIFTVVTNFIKDGKITRKVTDVNENETRISRRETRTILIDGQKTTKYQITYQGKVFCSEDNVNWTSSRYECFGPVSMYFGRGAESIEYSVSKEKLQGKNVNVYRKYIIYPTKEGSQIKDFRERISTIDSRGFYVNILDIEGTLDPKIVTLRRTQSWNTKANFKKIVPPKTNTN